MYQVQSKRTGQDLVFPDFKSIKVSTKTFTATSNLLINIKELFEKLPITPYVVVPKRRGRKKKVEIVDPNKDIPYGSIITIKCEDKIRGVELKPSKKKKRKKWFRNSITVIIVFDKPINFKVCRNGTFQMTGCKNHKHAELCIKYIWNYIKDDPSIYKFVEGNTLETLIIPSMRNIDFSLGFNVDREKLNLYMANEASSHCLLETSFGYTGVNIKMPLQIDITKMKIKRLTYNDKTDDWELVNTIYDEYLNKLPKKDRQAKIKNTRYNTFLVFHSGKVIMSGLISNFMKPVYEEFLEMIRTCYDQIEERLEISDF
jgi:TATA-box binding protein (TBP) (component of TFIID and TFIIIB)